MILSSIILSSITMGLIFGLVTLGTWLTSRVIAFDDLSIEGSFCFGGAITAQLLVMHMPAMLIIPIALMAGVLSGVFTAILHNVLEINNLLCGILATQILFALSLLVASANLPLLHTTTLFALPTGVLPAWWSALILLIIVIGAIIVVHWLLSTQIGLLVQALGSNKQLIISLGKRPAIFEGIALGLANALGALAGSLFVQMTGFFSIWSSAGVIVISLAGLMLGQLIGKRLVALVVGSIALQFIVALAFAFNMPSELHKLISAALIIIFTIISRTRSV